MDTPTSQKLEVIIPAYRMHTQIFLNALEGIAAADGLKRIDGKTNHLVWMAGNFVNMRYGLGGALGLREEDPYNAFFFQAKALDEQLDYPSLEQLIANFHTISPMVYRQLLQATDAQLSATFPVGMHVPFFEENVLNFVGMCMGRADYLCGQMGLLRKILGYDAIRYDINPTILY